MRLAGSELRHDRRRRRGAPRSPGRPRASECTAMTTSDDNLTPGTPDSRGGGGTPPAPGRQSEKGKGGVDVSRILFRHGICRGGATISLGAPLPTDSSGLPAPSTGSVGPPPEGSPGGRVWPREPSGGGGAVWPCTRWGLPCPACHQTGGALLPHLFTLTPKPGPVDATAAETGGAGWP